MPYHLSTPQSWKKTGDRGSPDPLPLSGVGDGTRTHNTWNHNPVLCQLNYTHHIDAEYCADHHSLRELVRQKGLEPLAHCLEGSCSIHLSYWRECIGAGDENRTRIPSLEGWCPDHCATPASALRGNRQLRYITMDKPICQAETRNFFLRLSCATSQRQPGGEKAPSICGSGQG